MRDEKNEGDGATPVGCFPLRRLFFRPDRIGNIATRLVTQPLRPDDGWCDDPADPSYNTLVRLPFIGSHERLWREDDLYDVIIVIGYNDAPAVPGRGSAIFLHIARLGYAPTEGCIALAAAHLIEVAGLLTAHATIEIFA